MHIGATEKLFNMFKKGGGGGGGGKCYRNGRFNIHLVNMQILP